jgi:hypothetical protein
MHFFLFRYFLNHLRNPNWVELVKSINISTRTPSLPIFIFFVYFFVYLFVLFVAYFVVLLFCLFFFFFLFSFFFFFFWHCTPIFSFYIYFNKINAFKSFSVQVPMGFVRKE